MVRKYSYFYICIHWIYREFTVASNLNDTKLKANNCYSSKDCCHGTCTENTCMCEAGYITWKDSKPCSYE